VHKNRWLYLIGQLADTAVFILAVFAQAQMPDFS